MLFYIWKNEKYKNINVDELSQIKIISLKNGNSNLMSLKKSSLIIYFSLNCEYCINEINSISLNVKNFNNVDILLVSSDSYENIVNFSTKFNNRKLNFIYDYSGEVKNILGVKNYPSIYIFSRNMKLVKFFKGETPINKILSEIPNE